MLLLLFCVLAGGSTVYGKTVFDLRNYGNELTPDVFQPAIYITNTQRSYSLRIKNSSRWAIYRLYMSSAKVEKWGPDQLGNYILRPGRSYTLTDIKPGDYDVMFVDQDNDKCVLRNVQIFKNTYWTLRSDWLLECQRNY